MSLTTTTYVDVRQRTIELGLGALHEFAILPRGFATSPTADGLADETEASTLRKVLNEAGIDVRQLRKSEKNTVFFILDDSSLAVFLEQISLQLQARKKRKKEEKKRKEEEGKIETEEGDRTRNRGTIEKQKVKESIE